MAGRAEPAFRETDIRPDRLRDEQARRLASDIRRLLAHEDDFVAVACPACGNGDGREAFQKYGLSFLRCRACETVYMSPRPTPRVLAEYYSTSENYAYWNAEIFPASEETRREKIFRPRAERVNEIRARYGIRPGMLLDVGAGFGTFCEEVSRLGVFAGVVAVEPTPDLAETCRRKGIEVIEAPIEDVQLGDGVADVIASFETIEHLYSPRDFLLRCRSLLAPGGLLVVTCPNVKGFDVMTLAERSETVDNEHLNLFHPRSLAALAEECGLEVLETLTPGMLDAELVRKKALGGEFDLGEQPFLQHVLIDEWDRLGGAFQRFLADNGLSSHMWLVARNPESVPARERR